MLPELKQYLTRVKSHSKLDPRAERDVVRELQTHFEDEIGELCQAGFSTAEATDVATERFGSAESLGRYIYEVYSKGSWGQALLSAIPHFLVALTFALHLWRGSFWLLAVALGITVVTTYAWCRGKPSWLYSWLGYWLISFIVISFLVLIVDGRAMSLFALEGSMRWVMILAYIFVVLWLLGFVLIRVVYRDWLFASFMLLPFPIIVAWLIALEQNTGLAEYSRGGFQGGDQEIALTFLALGGAAVTFIRLKQRLLKVGLLAVATLLIMAMVWRFVEGGLNPVVLFLVTLCLIGFLMSPALLQRRVVHRGNESESWDEAWIEQARRRA